MLALSYRQQLIYFVGIRRKVEGLNKIGDFIKSPNGQFYFVPDYVWRNCIAVLFFFTVVNSAVYCR